MPKKLVQWALKINGNVWYDYYYDGETNTFPIHKLPGPGWLRDSLGIDCFSKVSHISLKSTEVDGPSPLSELKNLPTLALFDMIEAWFVGVPGVICFVAEFIATAVGQIMAWWNHGLPNAISDFSLPNSHFLSFFQSNCEYFSCASQTTNLDLINRMCKVELARS